MSGFSVDVLTPSKVLGKDIPAESLLIPTVRGQINVLPDHTHIVTRLDTGVLSLFGGASDEDRNFVMTTGICKVLQDKVIILANTCEEVNDLDKERAQRSLKNATEVLQSRDDLSDFEIEKYRRKVERAQLRIQMAEKYGK